MVKDKKLYEILEVEPDASDLDIKKKYNKLSKIWHPDKCYDENKKKEVEDKFKEINEAKNILLDPEKRKLYDQLGMDMLKHDIQDNNNMDPFFHLFNIGGFQFNFNNFSNMEPKNEQNEHIEHIVEQVEATLEQIVNKEFINLNYKQKVYCNKCNGEGTNNGCNPKCKNCDGKGINFQILRMGNTIQKIINTCQYCQGKGKVIEEENKCNICNGKCFLIKDKNIQVPLSIDVLYGKDAVFQGKGHQFKNQKTHLIVKIKELPHKKFKRFDNNLYVEQELKLFQGLFGFDKILTHLDGRKLHISSSNKTDFNIIRKINGEGIPNLDGTKGDLYIKFIISLPNLSILSLDTRTQLKALLQLLDKNEVINETNVNKTPNLVKTICNDLKPEQIDKLNIIIENKIKKNIPKTDNNNYNDNQQQCTHQ
jgi:DnaJ-class molecular chaperone